MCGNKRIIHIFTGFWFLLFETNKPPSQGIYLGQASTTSSGIEMAASGETTIVSSTPGTNYKGRIQFNNTTNALSFFANSSATASLVLTDTATNIYNPTQFWYGVETGTADASGNFFARFSINQSGDVYTSGNVQCGNVVCSGTLTATNIYNKTAVDNLLSGKQNTITSSTDLTINKLITRTWEPPTGFTDVQIKADQVYVGNPVWLTATSISAKFWSPVYVDQGITVQNGLSIGMYSAGRPNQFAQTASISQNGNITTQGAITCQGNITSTFGNITSSIGNMSAYGNLESYNGNITASLGNISGNSISSTSTITATGHISGGTMTTNTLTTSSAVLNIKSDLVIFREMTTQFT